MCFEGAKLLFLCTDSIANYMIFIGKLLKLMTLSHHLTLGENRLLRAVISQIDPIAPVPAEFIITAKFYGEMFDVINPWKDMIDAADVLHTRYFQTETDLEFIHRHWILTIAKAERQEHLWLVFSDFMRAQLVELSKSFQQSG